MYLVEKVYNFRRLGPLVQKSEKSSVLYVMKRKREKNDSEYYIFIFRKDFYIERFDCFSLEQFSRICIMLFSRFKILEKENWMLPGKCRIVISRDWRGRKSWFFLLFLTFEVNFCQKHRLDFFRLALNQLHSNNLRRLIIFLSDFCSLRGNLAR